MSTPPKVILPELTSQKEARSLAIVDFPEPEGPTRAVTVSGSIVKEILCNTSSSSE